MQKAISLAYIAAGNVENDIIDFSGLTATKNAILWGVSRHILAQLACAIPGP